MVLAKHYTQAMEEEYKRSVRDQIGRKLRRAGKNYQITASIGCCRQVPSAAGTASIQNEAELFLRNADEAMYEEKQRSSRRE